MFSTTHLANFKRSFNHTDITPPYPSRPWAKPPTHSPPTPPTPLQPKHRHTSNTPPGHKGLVKPKPNPLIQSPPLHRPSQTHTHLTYSTNSSHPMHHSSITRQVDTIPEPSALTTPHPSIHQYTQHITSNGQGTDKQH